MPVHDSVAACHCWPSRWPVFLCVCSQGVQCPLCLRARASLMRAVIVAQFLWPLVAVPAAFCLCQPVSVTVTAVGFEPTPLRTGAWSQRLRPLGQTVMWHHVCKAVEQHSSSHRCCCSPVGVHTRFLWGMPPSCPSLSGMPSSSVCGLHVISISS